MKNIFKKSLGPLVATIAFLIGPFFIRKYWVYVETESNLVGYFVSYFVLISNSICLMFTASPRTLS